MNTYTHRFQDIDSSMIALAGGKGASLGELSRIADIHVPPGFVITTSAYKRSTANHRQLNSLLDELALLQIEERVKIAAVSAKIRSAIEAIPIGDGISAEIGRRLKAFDEQQAFAVRSSATAEDLPAASFAGQQDTYLNIIGQASILKHIAKCWASLFTERAVIYRLGNGFDHRKIELAIVVQQMVFPVAAGIMFTADPVTGNRKVVSIDAGFGLGEALVAGMVNADLYKVCDGKLIEKKITAKKLAIYASKENGKEQRKIAPENQQEPTLTEPQALELAAIGRQIETHFDRPQDIEWCLDKGVFYIVQSRPITTLYPIPEASDRQEHIYVSVGHQQMMTDALKPLGLSFFLLTTSGPMRTAGGRLFVDVAPHLASPVTREKIIAVLGQSDPLIKDALMTIIDRKGWTLSSPDAQPISGEAGDNKVLSWTFPAQFENDPAIVTTLIRNNQAALEVLKQNIRTKTGVDLFDFILEDIPRSRKILFDPQTLDLIMVAMQATSWINENMLKWLGEKRAADTLALSVPNNITSEMGLELMTVADVIRPYPEVIEYLQQTKQEDFWEGLDAINGGNKARAAIQRYLGKYGMRCAGEIDITRYRWVEKPSSLLPLLLNNIKNFEPDAAKQKFEQGRHEALKKETDLLERLKQLPDGIQKAKETKERIDMIRNFSGYREYPKYSLVSRYLVYKQALLKEAERLAHTNVIHEKEDVYYLSLEEFREVVSTNKIDHQRIEQRKADYKLNEKLTPPRVITSDGEIITGRYKRENLPPGALAGLAVSSGVVEGRARVILDMGDAGLEEGDILVTAFTDPSWTPYSYRSKASSPKSAD